MAAKKAAKKAPAKKVAKPTVAQAFKSAAKTTKSKTAGSRPKSDNDTKAEIEAAKMDAVMATLDVVMGRDTSAEMRRNAEKAWKRFEQKYYTGQIHEKLNPEASRPPRKPKKNVKKYPQPKTIVIDNPADEVIV